MNIEHNAEQWEKLDALLEQALELPVEQVEEFCRRSCPDDEHMRQFLYELVTSAQISDDDVRNAIFTVAQDISKDASLIGQRVGAYRFEKLLERGGMGEVYLGSRADGEFEKSVAIKVVRAKLDQAGLVQHFRTERQILANFSNPNIPALIDAGQLDDGRPYLVSEFIDGVPIDHYCEQNNLSIKERLNIIEELGQAIQYAHSNLVLHLDIKPANVLIDDERSPQLLDFGIARMMGDPDTGHKAFTPAYASPEQLSGRSPSTASDIYSFGVLMYRLFAREEPFETTRYSPRATKLAAHHTLNRKTKGRLFIAQLDTDLNAIIRKAMATEPADRYSSMADLLNDLRLYKRHVPISARNKTYAYRLQKFSRRHVGGLVFTACVTGLLAAFLVREIQLRQVAQAALLKADQQAETSERVSDFLKNLFSVTDPSEARGNSVTARELLDKGSQQIKQDLADQPLIASQLLHTMGSAYGRLGLYPQAEPLLKDALSQRQPALEEEDSELGKIYYSLGANYTNSAKFDEAEKSFLHAMEIQEKTLGREHVEIAETLRLLGNTYLRMGRTVEAERAHLRGIPIHEKTLGPNHPNFADHLASLGRVYFDMGRNSKSEDYMQRSLQILESQYDHDHPRLGSVVESLGNLYSQMKRYDDAETYLLRSLSMREKNLAPDHPYVTYSLMNVSALYVNTGRLEEAETYLLKAIGIQKQIFQADDYRLALSYSNLCELYQQRGQLDKAEHYGLLATSAFEKNLRPDHPYIGYASHALGKVYQDKNKMDKAASLFATSYAIFKQRDADDANRIQVTEEYAEFLVSVGREEDAKALD